jgi:hypothetical protein
MHTTRPGAARKVRIGLIYVVLSGLLVFGGTALARIPDGNRSGRQTSTGPAAVTTLHGLVRSTALDR